ncbi:MAG: bile acid:sodium symporter, partial [Desulfobacteraceae bacterium]|nr:bile acid:sodium symporter [Desulfobacteraceae bacterium]
FLKNNHGPSVMIFLIFVSSGLIIETDQIKDGIKDIKSTFAALLVILLISPFAALLLSFLPLDTSIIIGFFIVSVMPTTLSSGVVMTGRAGGNMAHALFVTIISNFASVVSIPVMLSFLLLFLQQERELSIDRTAIVIKLFFLVLLPLLVGMVLKKLIFQIKNHHKKILQTANQLLIFCIVFLSLAGARAFITGNGMSVLIIVFFSFVFHGILLGCSYSLAKVFKISQGKYESVIFMGSQKTLPLSVMIQVTYFPEYGSALLVCVIHHIIHLMMDGYIAVKLKPA